MSDANYWQERAEDAEKALSKLSAEYHAAINEPEYAGTRADWMVRCGLAEGAIDSVEQYLKPIVDKPLEECGPLAMAEKRLARSILKLLKPEDKNA